MRVPYSWLREYCDPGVPVEELAERLVMTGTEVERIDVGEIGRSQPPFLANGFSPHWSATNRNKKSISVDLKSQAGREIIHTLVRDADILRAQKWFWDRLRLVVEPGGATALAALLSGAFVPPPDARIGVVVCGANTDPAQVAT